MSTNDPHGPGDVPWPAMWSERAAVLVATGGGLGWLRPAPGTWGSIGMAIIAIAALVTEVPVVGWWWLALTIGLCGAAGWCVPIACRLSGVRDPSAVVIDEWAGVSAGLALMPHPSLAGAPVTVTLGVLVLFRVLDIAKPWPIRWFERLPGTWGVMLDDVVAGMAAGAIVRVVLV